jgi:hypothetical protein
MSDGVGDDPGIGGKMWTNGQWDFENPATSVIDNLKGTQPRANKTGFKKGGLEKLTSRLMFHDIYVQAVPMDKAACNFQFSSLNAFRPIESSQWKLHLVLCCM